MNRRDPEHPFPTLRAVVILTGVAIACGAAAVAASGARFDGGAAAAKVAAVTSAVVWFLALLGLAPVAILGPSGVMRTVGAYFAGMFLRFTGSLGGYVMVLMLTNLPADPVLYALVGTYVPLLFVEAAIVGRFLWQMDLRESNDSDPEKSPGGQSAGEVLPC